MISKCINESNCNQRSNCLDNAAHEIAAGHRSLTGTISCVSGRIRFLPVTMTGRFSKSSNKQCVVVNQYPLKLFIAHLIKYVLC